MINPDFSIYDEGTLVGFRPNNAEAANWLRQNTESEGYQWMGLALYVDHRMASGLIELINGFAFTMGR